MKKLLTISAAALLCGAMMSTAKTADELRIYLNPGHGSWTSNDRPMKTLKEVDGQLTVIDPGTKAGSVANTPDTTAFYETNTNIRKMLAVVDKLEAYGLKFDRTKNQTNTNPYRVGAALDLSNNIVMSHVMAGPYPHDPANAEVCNRSLKEIREEVEANNFDMFFSLHSNAASDGATVNYHAIFYRGWFSNKSHQDARQEYLRKVQEITEQYKDDPAKMQAELDKLNVVDERGSGDSQDTPDFAKGSIAMAQAVAPYTLGMAHQHWTARKTADVGSGCVIGDAEFQHNGEITTNNNSGKGYHGYYGVLKHGVPGFLAEGYFHTYQPSRQRAMNWDADRMEGVAFARGIADYWGLTKEKTGDIYGVVRDKEQKFNHTFYTPQGATSDKFLPLNGVIVILKDKDGKEVSRLVTDNFYNGVYVFQNVEPGTYTVEFEKEGYKMIDGENYTIEVAEATTTYPESWLIDVNWTPPTVVYNDYEDPLADEASVGAAGEYVMEQIYTDQAVVELDGLNIRRSILRNGNLYMLGFDANNAPVIKVIDANTREVKATVSTEGAEGNIRTLGDIAMTADGVLVAINSAAQTSYNEAIVNLYRWENDENGLPTGAPVKMGTTGVAGNWTAGEFGKTITYTGTIKEGKMIAANKSTANNNTRIAIYEVNDGVLGATNYNNFNSMDGHVVKDDEIGDFQYQLSPLHEDAIVITAEKCAPFEIQLQKGTGANGIPTLIAEIPEGMLEGTGFRGQFFKVAGEVFFVAPATDADGNNVGVQVLNVTAGLDKAKAVSTTNTAVAAPAAAQARAWAEVGAGVASVNGAIVVKRNADTNAYQSHSLELYLTRGNGLLTRISTEGIEQPVARANFAYDLAQSEDNTNGVYTLTFKSTGAAPAANIVLTNVADPTDVRTYPAGEIALGENTVTVDATELAENADYNWAVEIVDNPVPAAGLFYEQKRVLKPTAPNMNTRGGIVMITDPEQESFGTIIQAIGYAQGIDVFTPALELKGNYHDGSATMDATNGASLMRGGERDGKAVFIDWSDVGAGYWQFDPTDNSLTNILAGTKDNGGTFSLNGVALGGGATAFEVAGKGEDEKIYVFCEDYPTANAGNNLIRYSSAGKSIIDMAPDQLWTSANGFSNIHGKFANTNVEINAIPQGLIISQNRNNANSKGCPCFEICSYDGAVLLSSGDDDYIDFYHSCSGGIAATADGKVMAIPTWGNGIQIVDIDWTDASKPVLTHRYTISAPTNGTSGEYTQMIFDPAGNLYAFDRASGLKMFTLTNSAPKAVTPARSELVIKSANTGVEDVLQGADNNDAPVEYYDLQGRRINEPAAGTVVIRRQGTDVQKIVIR